MLEHPIRIEGARNHQIQLRRRSKSAHHGRASTLNTAMAVCDAARRHHDVVLLGVDPAESATVQLPRATPHHQELIGNRVLVNHVRDPDPGVGVIETGQSRSGSGPQDQPHGKAESGKAPHRATGSWRAPQADPH